MVFVLIEIVLYGGDDCFDDDVDGFDGVIVVWNWV